MKRFMRKRQDIVRVGAYLAGVLLCACMLSSCLSDDYDECATGRTTVQLHIVADGISDLNATRATFDDKNADDGEFMNTLCVFIVDGSGKILTKLEPVLTDNSDAQEGNLTEYSTTIDVSDDAAKIYAFSNWDNMDCEAWNSLISKGVGDNISSTDLSFAIDDPASKVDPANGKYIPMSGQAAVDLKGDLNASRNIEVTMDRLVGKVVISIDPLEHKQVTLDSLTFKGWADKVPLFYDENGSEPEGINYNDSIVFKLNETVDTTETTSKKLCSFYVNETYRSTATDDVKSEGYTVKLTTSADEAFDEYDGAEFTATTARQDIPRNNIYPLTLTLDRYEMKLSVTAWYMGIGTAQIVYYNDGRTKDGSYLITLSDKTTQATITPKILDTENSDEEVSGVTWTWTYLGDDEFQVEQGDNGVLTCTQFTAYASYTYEFTLIAEWTTGESPGITHTRTYNIQVLLDSVDTYILFLTSITNGWIEPQTIERLELTSSKVAEAEAQQ